MSRHAKGVLAAAVLVVVTGAGIWLSRDRGRFDRADRAAPSTAPPGFAVAPPAAEPPAPPPWREEQDDQLMKAWRQAILDHDADTVLMCDRTFLGDPGHFTAMLVKSARTDSNERVRAFSTRVLGKFEDRLLVDTFRQQLGDASPFVRENAAWALGQLAAPARDAAGDLEKTMKHDKADAVRRAAEQALEKVRAGGTSRGRAG